MTDEEHPVITIRQLLDTVGNTEPKSEERINQMAICDKVLEYGNDTKYEQDYLKKRTIGIFEIAYEKVKGFSKSIILKFENLIATAKDFAKEVDRLKYRRRERELARLELTLNM